MTSFKRVVRRGYRKRGAAEGYDTFRSETRGAVMAASRPRQNCVKTGSEGLQVGRGVGWHEAVRMLVEIAGTPLSRD